MEDAASLNLPRFEPKHPSILTQNSLNLPRWSQLDDIWTMTSFVVNLKQVEPVDINSKYLEPARWDSAKDCESICDWWKGKLPNTILILTLSDHMQEEGGDWKCEPWRSDQSSLPAPAPVCHHSKLDFYNHICPSHKTRLASNKCSLLRHQRCIAGCVNSVVKTF